MTTPPTFSVGQTLTSAQMNAVGLWLVKSQTVGTGVSSVTVSNAFSADYDNYKIIYDGGSCSTNISLSFKLGAATSGYLYAIVFNQYTSATPSGLASGAGSSFPDAGRASTDGNSMILDVVSPYLSRRTGFRASSTDYAAAGYIISGGGFLNNTNSYTDFTIAPNAGTITGGTIRVYGYRN